MQFSKMKRTIYFLLACLLASCSSSGLRMGVGLPGAMLDNDYMTLNGETLRVFHSYGDSFVIAYRDNADNDPKRCYLLRKRQDSCYVPICNANFIHEVYDSERFYHIDRMIYDLATQKLVMKAPLDDTYGYSYLGQYDGLYLFCTLDGLFFSDGKSLPMQYGVRAEKGKTESSAVLKSGALAQEFPIADIRRAIDGGVHRDSTVEWMKKEIFLDPKRKENLGEANLWYDMEWPKGNTAADRAIRRRLLQSVEEDAGSLLGTNLVMTGRLDGTAAEAKAALGHYVDMWGKVFLAENKLENSPCMYAHLCSQKVVDCEDYVTYFYQAECYWGGMHGNPFAYYITYDKRRGMLLSAENSVKPSMMHQVRREALKSLQPQYLDFNDERSPQYYACGISLDADTIAEEAAEAEEAEATADSTEMDSFIEQTNTLAQMLLHTEYPCDRWSGWWGECEGNFTEYDFPLPHFAIIPEGIVLSYHPYQIDCFAAGEYHAAIPFDKIKGCLQFDYSHHKDQKPQLWRFIERRAK